MSIKAMPKISVVVPCYNVAPYLPRCLDSLIGQTLYDIEIICVDDKSTDKSLEILRKYAARDDRISIIALDKNGGVALARNHGIDVARGQYIGFVDPDDYIDTDFYEKLYARACETGAEIVVSNIRETALNGRSHTLDSWLKRVQENKLNFDYTLWCAIYQTDFVRNNKIYNPVGTIVGEDAVFIVQCAVLARQIATVPDVYYNYVRRNNSLQSQIQSISKIKAKISSIRMICDILNNADISDADYDQYYTSWYSVLQSLVVRNTSVECIKLVVGAMNELYKSCKRPNSVMQEYKKQSEMCRAIARYLLSEDTDGLLKYMQHIQGWVINMPHPDVRYNHTIYLFASLPLLRIRRTVSHTVIRFCGLKLFESKSSPTNYRMCILYIPIIRIKSK